MAAKIRADAGALEGERKQVTVLFADVVGSMELASQTDPEAWRGIMKRLFSLSCDAVHRYEGTVDKFTGDGMMAIFGAPIAHEDHARRACYAALELQERLTAYAEELRSEQDLELAIRIGLNSGEVVVGAIGDDLEMDYTAIGPHGRPRPARRAAGRARQGLPHRAHRGPHRGLPGAGRSR